MGILDIIQILRSMVGQTSVSTIKLQGKQLLCIQLHGLYFKDNVFQQLLLSLEGNTRSEQSRELQNHNEVNNDKSPRGKQSQEALLWASQSTRIASETQTLE